MRPTVPKLPEAMSSRLPSFPFRRISAGSTTFNQSSGSATFEEDRGSMAASTTDFVRMDAWYGCKSAGSSARPPRSSEMSVVAAESIFEEYEREVRMLFEKVQEELHAVEAGASSQKAESMMGEIVQNRRALQMRIRTDGNLRARWGPMLEEWDTQLNELRAILKSFQDQNRRTQLFDARQVAVMQIRNSEDKLEEGTQLLERAHHEILEAENVGAQIACDLASQREVILHARHNMGTVGNELQAAASIVKDIMHRYRSSKYSTYIASAIVALLFMTAAYFIFCSGGEPPKLAPHPHSRAQSMLNVSNVNGFNSTLGSVGMENR